MGAVVALALAVACASPAPSTSIAPSAAVTSSSSAASAVVPTASSSASPAEAASAGAQRLAGLALQPGDVDSIGAPGDFTRFDEGPLVHADALPPPQSDPARFGHVAGWKARYKRADPQVTTGVLVIDSRIDEFADAPGAMSDLAAYRVRFAAAATGGQADVVEAPGVGDDSVLSVSRGAADAVHLATLAWRRGAFTAQVAVSGLGPSAHVDDAAKQLARAVDARLVAAH